MNFHLDKEDGMTQEELDEKIREVSKYWGRRMPMMAIEEAGELIQAICKMERNDALTYADYKATVDHLAKEMADMWISLQALEEHYNSSIYGFTDGVDEAIEQKLQRKYE